MSNQEHGLDLPIPAMHIIRGRLIAKIDEIVSQIAASDTTPSNSLLQIEANLVSHTTAGPARRIVLDTISVDDLRYHIGDSRSSSPWNTPVTSTFPHGLPSPNNSNYAPTPPSRTGVDLLAYDQSLHTTGVPPYTSSFMTNNVMSELHQSTQHARSTPVLNHVSSMNKAQTSEPDIQQPAKRRRLSDDSNQSEQPVVDKLIQGIWEQIHKPTGLAMGSDLVEAMSVMLERMSGNINRFSSTNLDFGKATKYCRQITTGSRTTRAFEVIVQAHWVDCYDARLRAIKEGHPHLRPSECKKMVMGEACSSFAWSEKELRNRISVWRGYQEIKNAAGWTALIFAGPGIYRFCKYRLCFDQSALAKLRSIKSRAELAADTLQPQWRSLLSLVGQPTHIQWHGHPHDWTVSIKEGGTPLPLAATYTQWDPNFNFHNLQDSIIDVERWGNTDPRRWDYGPEFICRSCTLRQSAIAEENECQCFPDLYSPNPPRPCPVQIFQTEDGKNNGLIACCPFEAGQAVGEFVGMITQGLADVDVMQSQAGNHEPYQIWQGNYGNYTRFMNHSCVSNCEFQTFSWLGIQRIVVVSKGVPAGKELTVDYSSRYWNNLDKVCLCGEPTCHYNNQSRGAFNHE